MLRRNEKLIYIYFFFQNQIIKKNRSFVYKYRVEFNILLSYYLYIYIILINQTEAVQLATNKIFFTNRFVVYLLQIQIGIWSGFVISNKGFPLQHQPNPLNESCLTIVDFLFNKTPLPMKHNLT